MKRVHADADNRLVLVIMNRVKVVLERAGGHEIDMSIPYFEFQELVQGVTIRGDSILYRRLVKVENNKRTNRRYF